MAILATSRLTISEENSQIHVWVEQQEIVWIEPPRVNRRPISPTPTTGTITHMLRGWGVTSRRH